MYLLEGWNLQLCSNGKEGPEGRTYLPLRQDNARNHTDCRLRLFEDACIVLLLPSVLLSLDFWKQAVEHRPVRSYWETIRTSSRAILRPKKTIAAFTFSLTDSQRVGCNFGAA